MSIEGTLTATSSHVGFIGAPQVGTFVPRYVPFELFTFSLPFSESESDKQLAAEFKKLAKAWKDETIFISNPEQKYLHPSYARIIGLGRPAVKLILQSMKRAYGDWFYALRAMTNANPVTDDMAGDVPRMTEAWLKWGRKEGII